jgi:hypothetical protein
LREEEVRSIMHRLTHGEGCLESVLLLHVGRDLPEALVPRGTDEVHLGERRWPRQDSQRGRQSAGEITFGCVSRLNAVIR